MSKFLVAIGHFNQPSVVRLQARAIRATVGPDTPILVSDDHSETAFDEARGTGPDHGRRVKQRLLDVCEREGLIYRDTAPERLGHAGGDLGAFYHGLTYARDNGIEWVCKLSQRFVIDIPQWFQATARLMAKFDYNTATRGCWYHDKMVFHMRTECVVMRTFPWIRPDVLNDLRPRLLTQSTEHLISDLCGRVNGGVTKFIAPRWLVEDRHERHPGVAWKDALPRPETEADYDRLFLKYGCERGDDFNADHSVVQHGHRSGIVGH